MTLRRCPTGHRNIEEDGVRVERERQTDGGTRRLCYVLATCHDCGQRVMRAWDMRPRGTWQSVAEMRATA